MRAKYLLRMPEGVVKPGDEFEVNSADANRLASVGLAEFVAETKKRRRKI